MSNSNSIMKTLDEVLTLSFDVSDLPPRYYHFDNIKYIFMSDNNVYVNEHYSLLYNEYMKFNKGFGLFCNICNVIENNNKDGSVLLNKIKSTGIKFV